MSLSHILYTVEKTSKLVLDLDLLPGVLLFGVVVLTLLILIRTQRIKQKISEIKTKRGLVC
jgi:hypothetical protein